MPQGKGTYGSVKGRPPRKKQVVKNSKAKKLAKDRAKKRLKKLYT